MVLKGFLISETGATESRSIPDWSTKHFEANGRPLRIAIDQANWWYRNITAEKEIELKTKSPGSHPRVKRILERIVYLLRLNIQLLFVFDGPDKPSKKYPSEYSFTESNIRLLKELLDQLGVPRHEAPGESAAECVRLQELGIIDAIWTDNTDALVLHGSPTLVQFRKNPEGDQFKNSSTVLVSSAADIRARANLTPEWFLMYATLVGCGYMSGLEGFDATRFFRFAQHSSFQGAANLLAIAVETPLVLSKWRIIVTNIITETLANEKVAIATPSRTFPDLTMLKNCAHPVVSPDDTLRDLPCLRSGWFRSYGPDMLSRYRFLLSNFNTQIHESWVARDLVPIELNHRLRETRAGDQATNRHLGIKIRSKRKATPDSTIAVDPVRVLPELLSAFPSEMYRLVNSTRVKIEPPVFRPEEMQLLDCVLRHGLGEGADVPESAAQVQPQIQTKEVSTTTMTTTATTATATTRTATTTTATTTTATTTTATTKKKKPPVPPPKNKHKANRRSASTQTHIKDFLTIITKKTKKPPIPPKNEKHRAFQPTRRPTKRRSNTIRSVKSPPPVLTSFKTHRPLALALPLRPHVVVADTGRGGLACDYSREDLTLPGDLDWHDLPVSSALAATLSGPADQHRKPSMAMTAPLPILKQPTWDHSAVIDLPDLD
ncbi:hypothetical protein F5B18DRAFT_670632 [Nemania serpens]|nr:hypothetical protein F5B18DRAFT_670632 [Nemania serpens]